MPVKKKRVRLILIIVAVLAVLGAAAAMLAAARGRDTPEPAYLLEKTTLAYLIEADGLIEASEKAEVYAPSNLKVGELFAREGDLVREGDALAQLDIEALSLEVRRAELNIQSAQASLSSEQLALANSVTSARNALSSATVSLSAAQREYDSLLSRRGSEASVVTASVNLDIARRAAEHAGALYELGDLSQEELAQAENALAKALAAYDDAARAAAEAEDRAREALDDAKVRHKNAEDEVANAVSRNTDPAAVALDLQKVALEEKRLRLRDARVTAPISGRVTLVTAKEGAPASGLMFVIENERDLIVRARVEESDMADLAVGMECRIAPAGREREFAGAVTFLPPAAERDATGEFTAATGDDVYFVVEASFRDAPAGVLVGMNAKVSFVADIRTDCFAAPRGLVYRDGERRYVLAREQNGAIAEITVETGLETGTLTEIAAGALHEGMELFKK